MRYERSVRKMYNKPTPTNSRHSGIIKFVIATVLVFPLLFQMAHGFRRRPDRAWCYHLPVCWVTLWIYGIGTLRKLLGAKQAPVARDKWQK